MTSSANASGPTEGLLQWLMEPSAALFSGLAALMMVTLYLGIEHARDRDEELSIRVTGGFLAAISIGVLALGLSALLRS